ncbi:MAG: tetratricopeptide repeat-containing sensor histidine kinase [Bacteroidales bacterium]|jgi:two-component system sensor histidine kinase/response regulator|nr:tetratricopeptide repeat-containing sensor histidine kinase [Bacteroidales bacterium]
MKRSVGILFICLLALLNSTKINADISIDSILVSIRSMPNDTNKVLKLAKLAKKYTKFQIDTSLILGNDALKLAQSLEYKRGVAYSFYILGIVYRYYGDYDKSLDYSQKAFEIFENINNKSYKGLTLNSLGNLYKRKGDYEASLNSFLQGLAICNELKDSSLISSIINNIALLYLEMEQYDKSLEYQFKNLEIKKKLELHDNIPIVLSNIGIVYNAKGEFKIALDYYKEALDLIPLSVNNYDKTLLLHNTGNAYLKINRYSEANYYYQKALELEQKIGGKSLKIYTLRGIGLVLIKTGKFSEGEKYLLESFQLAKELGELGKQSVIAFSLCWAYENQKQYKNGLIYSKLYIELKDSILDLGKIKQIATLEQKYDAEKREQQIAFMEKEQVLQKLELSKREVENKQKSLQRNILFIAIILTLLLAIYFWLENKKRKKLYTLLQKQNSKILDQRSEIAKQNDELLESNKTKDKLFQIIAHDLRSPLISVDSIARLIPYWLENQDYDSLYKFSETLEISVNNVLSLVDDLLNWALTQQNKFPIHPKSFYLKKAILKSIEIYKPIAKIKNISLEFICSKDIVVFADQNMLSAVVRNLLNNAVKFTPEKGEIIIGFEENNSFAKIWVKDSGIGISDEKKDLVFQLDNGNCKGTQGESGKGLGLFFCKEFVSLNNGNIFVESDKGKGTTITFTLPLFNLEKN